MAITPASAQTHTHVVQEDRINDLVAKQKSIQPKVLESTRVEVSAKARALYDREQETKTSQAIAARDAHVAAIAESNAKSHQDKLQATTAAQKANTPTGTT